jgi:hypothetical protein
MLSLTVEIGEHVLLIRFQNEYTREVFHATFPHMNEIESESIDLTLDIAEGFGSPFTDYRISKYSDPEGSEHYTRTDYKLTMDARFQHANILFYNELALKHAFMHLISAYVVHRGWGLLVHSSCILNGTRAHLFAGKSGAGKSTVTELSLPRGIFSDEATLMKISPEAVTVYHSPFRSDYHTALEEQLNPNSLGSIQILEQSLTNTRVQLKKSESMLTLIDKVFYWAPSPEATTMIMAKLKQLVDIVPVYQLHFRKDATFWELII